MDEVYDATEAVNALKRIVGPKFVSFLLKRVGARVEGGRVLMDSRALGVFADSVVKVLGSRLARDVLSLVPGIPEGLVPQAERREARKSPAPGPGPKTPRVRVAPEGELDEASRRFDDVVWLSSIIFRMKLVGIRRVALPGGSGNLDAIARAAEEEGLENAYLVVRQGGRLARLLIEDETVKAAFYQEGAGKYFGARALEKLASLEGDASVEVIRLG